MKILRTALYSIFFLASILTAMDDSHDLHNPESLLTLTSRAVVKNEQLWGKLDLLPNDIFDKRADDSSNLPKIDEDTLSKFRSYCLQGPIDQAVRLQALSALCYKMDSNSHKKMLPRLRSFLEQEPIEKALETFSLASSCLDISLFSLVDIKRVSKTNLQRSLISRLFSNPKRLAVVNPRTSSLYTSTAEIPHSGFRAFVESKKEPGFVYNGDASKAVVFDERHRIAWLYDMKSGKNTKIVSPLWSQEEPQMGTLYCADWDPFDNSRVFFGDDLGYVHVYDAECKEFVKDASFQTKHDNTVTQVFALACDPHHKDQIAVPCMGDVKLYQISTGKVLKSLGCPTLWPWCSELQFHPKIKDVLFIAESSLYMCDTGRDKNNEKCFTLFGFQNNFRPSSLLFDPKNSDRIYMKFRQDGTSVIDREIVSISPKAIQLLMNSSVRVVSNEAKETYQSFLKTTYDPSKIVSLEYNDNQKTSTELVKNNSDVSSVGIRPAFASLLSRDRILMASPLLFGVFLAFLRK